MFKDYRCAVLAVVGWLALSGAQPLPNQIDSNKSAGKVAPARQVGAPLAANPAAGRSLKSTPYTGYNLDPCAEDTHAADLCAQWRAAIAAEKATHEARRATTWSIVATLLNALSLIAVGIALYLTVQSNGIARDTAKRELRAYISIEPGGVNKAQDGLARVPMQIINVGNTPAHHLEVFGDFLIVGGDPRQFDPKEHSRFSGQLASTDMSLGGNSERWNYAYLPEELAAPFLDEISRKEKAIVHYGFLRYRDIFNDMHETHFAFYHWGEELSAVESKRCRFGNWST